MTSSAAREMSSAKPTLNEYQTADNDSRQRTPYTASFRTAPRGRVRFCWTSYGMNAYLTRYALPDNGCTAVPRTR